MNTPEPVSELDRLKQEIAALRQEVTELRQFFTIEPPKKPTAKSSLHIRCASVRVCSPHDWRQVQGELSASPQGASFILRADGKDRVELSTDEGAPCLEFLTAQGASALELAAEKATGCGYVAVFDASKPRALMKATDKAGLVSVVHDDGKLRAGMMAHAEGGEIMAMRAGLKNGVKLSATVKEGSALSVHGLNGELVASLNSTPQGSLFVLNNPAGHMGCSIACLNDNAVLRLQTTADPDQGVHLLCGKELGASVRVSTGQNHPLAELSVLADASTLSLANAQGQERVKVESLADHAGLTLTSADDKVKARLINTGQLTFLHLGSKEDHGALVNSAPDTAMFVLKNPKEENQFIAACKDDDVSVLLLPKAGPQAALCLATNQHGGCLSVSDREGVLRGGLTAIPAGGQLTLFNDLGIERANLLCADDGGALKLNWGGTVSVIARGMEKGGVVLVNDGQGQPAAILPPHGLKGEGEGEEA